MIKVPQTINFPTWGNCHAACIASIFEIPLDSVPRPTGEETEENRGFEKYGYEINRKICHPRGLHMLRYYADPNWLPPGFSILELKYEGVETLHCVVALDGEIVWNPCQGDMRKHDAIESYSLFIALDPSIMPVLGLDGVR